MATTHQVPCEVLPGTNEYFSDETVSNGDKIEFVFKNPVTLEDLFLTANGTVDNVDVEIIYPNSQTTSVLKSSLNSNFYLNPPGTATAKLWFDLPAKSVLRASFGSGTSTDVKFCAIATA